MSAGLQEHLTDENITVLRGLRIVTDFSVNRQRVSAGLQGY